MDGGNITRASVGRVAHVGDLYDARSETFCGISILKKAPPPTALRITDNNNCKIEYVHSDTFSEKFEKLGIAAELKLSILAGAFTLAGHGQYLSYEKKSARAVRSSLVYTVNTKVERLNLTSEDLKDCLELNALKNDRGTHVVIDVYWGANATITMESMNSESKDRKEVEGALSGELNRIALKVNGKAEVDYKQKEEKKEMNFSLRVFADVLPAGDLPQTVEGAIELMKKIPLLVREANDGKGKPIRYMMVPISTLKCLLNESELLADRLVKQLDEEAIARFVQLFDEISGLKQELNDLRNDMVAHEFCVLKDDIKKVREIETLLNSTERSIRSKLAATLIEVRSGRAGAEQLENIRKEFEDGDFSLSGVQSDISGFHNVIEKMKFTDILKAKGVNYIGYGKSLYSAILEKGAKEYYIFFCSWNTEKGLRANRQHFNSLVDQNELPCFLADIDAQPDIGKEEGVPNGNRICLYSNGKYISYDCYAEYLKDKDICLVKCIQKRVPFVNKSNKRVDVEIICPQSMNGRYCQRLEREWICAVCRERLQYDFNYNFLCGCGSASINTFQFRCCDDKHGSKYVSFGEDYLKSLVDTIRPYRENPPLPDFITGLNVQQQTLIESIWNSDTLTLSKKIACIDELSGNMTKETRREYRRWRFEHDKSSVNAFLEKQKPSVQNRIRLCLSSQSNLDEFYNSMRVLLPSFDDKEAFFNWANSEMLQRNRILFYLAYGESPNFEGKICLFNSSNFEVEIVEKFSTWIPQYGVATGNDQIFLIDGCKKVFEIFNYETKQLTKGPDPPEWRNLATVAYYKNKLYYIGGKDSNCVNILVNGKWQRGPDFPKRITDANHTICNDKLYIISENAVFQLSDNEREWMEVGKMEETRWHPAVASLNGKIYITGGYDGSNAFNSCLCFDPSQPPDKRFTSIANMHFDRYDHSLVVANGKLYAIGGYQEKDSNKFCKSIEEYDPATKRWRKSRSLLDFITGLNMKLQTLIKDILNSDNLTLDEKIARIDLLEDKMEEETRREYRRWRFEHDKSSVNAFLEKQNPTMQDYIRLCLSSQPNLDEFHNSMLVLLPSFDDKEAFLNWEKSETLQWDILFYLTYSKRPNYEGGICLFNSSTFEDEIVEKFSTCDDPFEVAIGNDKIFLINGWKEVFEIFDYETKKLTKGPDPPQWRVGGAVAYYKDKVYYIGGYNNCVNLLLNGKWQRGPDFPIEVAYASHTICNDKLYIISYNAVFQLSDNERKWLEVGKLKGERWHPAVASLNGKIYIIGGFDGENIFNSCLCFDPSQPFDKRFTSIANMKYKRESHSLVVANGKLYAIGGFQEDDEFCKSVEEYDPITNRWQIYRFMSGSNISRVKASLLSTLAQCSTPSPLQFAMAKHLLYEVFNFCVSCEEHSLTAFGEFTPAETEQLENNLLIAIPRLESNLRETLQNLGSESISIFCIIRSGLQFLDEELVARQSKPDIDLAMDDLLQSSFVQEIDSRLKHWKEVGEWDANETFDLRFVPESHDWWMDEQREASKNKYGTG